MNHLTVRCEGNSEIAVVEIRFQTFPDRIHLAEVVPTLDPMVQRRVNREVLNLHEHLELAHLIEEDEHRPQWYWDMEAVEALALGYLNRQSETRVQLNTAWKTELVNSPDRVS